MKKVLLLIAVFVGITSLSNAQVQKKAVGLRFGNLGGLGAEVTYQQPYKNNRIELDLGLNSAGFGINGIYQWVKPLPEFEDGFYLYYGGGVSLGYYTYNSNPKGINLGIIGQIGLEYDFEFPLQISIDLKPCIYLIPPVALVADNICVAVRYRF